jgi:hypothetical protein
MITPFAFGKQRLDDAIELCSTRTRYVPILCHFFFSNSPWFEQELKGAQIAKDLCSLHDFLKRNTTVSCFFSIESFKRNSGSFIRILLLQKIRSSLCSDRLCLCSKSTSWRLLQTSSIWQQLAIHIFASLMSIPVIHILYVSYLFDFQFYIQFCAQRAVVVVVVYLHAQPMLRLDCN